MTKLLTEVQAKAVDNTFESFATLGMRSLDVVFRCSPHRFHVVANLEGIRVERSVTGAFRPRAAMQEEFSDRQEFREFYGLDL